MTVDYPHLGTWIMRFEDGMKLGDGMNCEDVDRWGIKRDEHGRWMLIGAVDGDKLTPNLLIGFTENLDHACTTQGWYKLIKWSRPGLFPHDVHQVLRELVFMREVYRRVLTEDD
jgi:hypothetical protein